ncbi:hypothetical protein C8R45DRAFT_1044195 [Mycena sanguinolenta]|nr:hypothetical protein C8R45DRAFT_1044195 [Mycena sanguinolenta]
MSWRLRIPWVLLPVLTMEALPRQPPQNLPLGRRFLEDMLIATVVAQECSFLAWRGDKKPAKTLILARSASIKSPAPTHPTYRHPHQTAWGAMLWA